MPDAAGPLPHLLVHGYVEDREFTRGGGGGDGKVRPVERRAHGERLKSEAERALEAQDARRETLEELESLGVVITIEGATGFPLKLESLEQRTTHHPPRPKWLLLSVHSATEDKAERAQVWVSDDYRPKFLERLEQFIAEDTPRGKPKHRALVANIDRIRATVLEDLWQSADDPPMTGRHWWEVWLQPNRDAIELANRFADTLRLAILERSLRFDNRHVVWIQARWRDLLSLPFSPVPITEIRRPVFVDTIEDLETDEQQEYVEDLSDRIVAAACDVPAVCLLDTGVRRTHILINASLSADDMHSVVGLPAGDVTGHGTSMAGLALLGPLEYLLTSSEEVRLLHRLESVKFLPDAPAPEHLPEAYGLVTAEAMALPGIASRRSRVFSLTITCPADRPGEPSLWSASVDTLAAGTDIGRSSDAIDLLGPPNDDAKRLVIVSAGNIDPPYETNYRARSDLSPIEDPAQAWNALVVGASTGLCNVPTDPTFADWVPLAEEGDISPHSRTGVIAGGDQWPIKPDICMEGGNVLTDGARDFHTKHPVVSLRTSDARNDSAVGSANATSAAAAQAARLAARAMATYPHYWPETIRGLLTHSAEWTSAMRTAIFAESGKKKRRQLLRRYGWGVPDDYAVQNSERNAVTMVVQDSFVPFTGKGYKMRQFRLHELPWPTSDLMALGPADVELRVTLSYFVEPAGSRRGWRRRFTYASHGLRFELRAPNETTAEFVRRVNRVAAKEEDQTIQPASGTDSWALGPNQRNKGSLHQDIWRGHGAELATTGVIAVHAVGGWWKYNSRKDRQDLSVRYALLVSLRTPMQDVDIYTPIATSIGVPVEGIAVEI